MLFAVDPGRDDGGLVHQYRMNRFAVRALGLHLDALRLVNLKFLSADFISHLVVPVVGACLRACPLVRGVLPCAVGLLGPRGEFLSTDDAGLLGGHWHIFHHVIPLM